MSWIAGIVARRGIGPVEAETVGFSHRKVDLSAGDGRLARSRAYDRSDSAVFESIPSP